MQSPACTEVKTTAPNITRASEKPAYPFLVKEEGVNPHKKRTKKIFFCIGDLFFIYYVPLS